jgi:predicted TIM-barrel fold metal-dependent hydrolase
VEKFPDVKLIVPHLGLLGGNPVSFLREFRNRENVYFDTSLASQGTIKRFLDELGDDRVIFGSDVPFGVMESEAEKIKNLDVDKKVKRRLFHRNIEKICRLS